MNGEACSISCATASGLCESQHRHFALDVDRPLLNGAFLNTKRNSITLRDYTERDGWRGPGVTFGWIQGRGLEALVTHARFFESEDPDLAARLDAAARQLYPALSSLFARDGHAYFAYGENLAPVYPDAAGDLQPQEPAGDLWTFSDIFVLKGLVAAPAGSHRRRRPAMSRA